MMKLFKSVSDHKPSGICVVGEYWHKRIVKKKRGKNRKGC
jgi:hypothetical protein